MNHSTSNSPGVEVGRHPGWCAPVCCITDELDTHHASVPSTLETGTALWEGALLRRVDLAHPDSVEPTQLRIDVTDLDLTGRDVQITAEVDDLPRIARWLMTEYERAIFTSAPAVQAMTA